MHRDMGQRGGIWSVKHLLSLLRHSKSNNTITKSHLIIPDNLKPAYMNSIK